MYEAVEVFVNIFQAFAITFYLIKCLGVKEGKNRKCAYITGVIVTVLYLEIMNRIIFFESVGVLIYLEVFLYSLSPNFHRIHHHLKAFLVQLKLYMTTSQDRFV